MRSSLRTFGRQAGWLRHHTGSSTFGRLSSHFWVMSAFLVILFALGGGSRPDIHSLIFLRPLSAIVLGYGLWDLSRADWFRHRFLLGMAAAIIVLIAVQLVPLPPKLWSALPGRELIVEIDRAAGLGAVWRPISLVPSGTWNSLFSLLPPIAILVLGMRLSADELAGLVPLIIFIGLISGLIAVLQLGGAPDGPLYFYRVTNDGGAVGLFANRNHQAFFLASLFPMLGACASGNFLSSIDRRLRVGLALTAGLFLVPLILVTGSRAGVLAGVFGLATVALLFHYREDKSGELLQWQPLFLRVAISFVGAGLVAVTMVMGRALAINRFFAQSAAEEDRYRAWGSIFSMGIDYFPFGSGMGTFFDVFRVAEPYEMLAPTSFRHAHNDFLEIFATGGLPGMFLLGSALLAYGRTCIGWWGSSQGPGNARVLSAAGLGVVTLLGGASIVDYPLRVPSLSCLFVIAALWACAFRSQSPHQDENCGSSICLTGKTVVRGSI